MKKKTMMTWREKERQIEKMKKMKKKKKSGKDEKGAEKGETVRELELENTKEERRRSK